MHREHYHWTQPHAVAVSDLIGMAVGHPDAPGAIEQARVDLTPDGCRVETVVAWADDISDHWMNIIDDCPIHGRTVADYLEDDMEQITREQAIEIADSGVWKEWSDDQVVRFQLYQNCLAMDFGRFHEALEAVLGRPVWTHELANRDRIVAEYEGKREPPTFTEVLEMIPTEKRIVVEV